MARTASNSLLNYKNNNINTHMMDVGTSNSEFTTDSNIIKSSIVTDHRKQS
ncbi:9662_t:CDS:2, partial [Ambispora leptoticha]